MQACLTTQTLDQNIEHVEQKPNHLSCFRDQKHRLISNIPRIFHKRPPAFFLTFATCVSTPSAALANPILTILGFSPFCTHKRLEKGNIGIQKKPGSITPYNHQSTKGTRKVFLRKVEEAWQVILFEDDARLKPFGILNESSSNAMVGNSTCLGTGLTSGQSQISSHVGVSEKRLPVNRLFDHNRPYQITVPIFRHTHKLPVDSPWDLAETGKQWKTIQEICTWKCRFLS